MARLPNETDTVAINLIGEGSEVEGILRSSTDVRVNGRVTGEVNVEGRVIVADKGVIDGTLSAANADVAGTVLGDLNVTERLLLKSTARVEGTIKTARLVVEEGAMFDGQCDMGRLDKKRKERIDKAASAPPEKKPGEPAPKPATPDSKSEFIFDPGERKAG
jgi:cytoskeletal protein CcmA (bactofilin family)